MNRPSSPHHVRRIALAVLTLCLLALAACRAAVPAPTPTPPTPTAAPRPTPADKDVAEPDEFFYHFGLLLPVAGRAEVWRLDPHSTAVYSVWRCAQGDTEALVSELPYAEEDPALGESFGQFVRVFGPDLERYQKRSIALRFVGVKQGRAVSVWYYALLDEQGQPLDDHSWVTVHRSKADGRCALAGIFVNEFGEQPVYLPEDLITSR